jgi:hypothetical protein
MKMTFQEIRIIATGPCIANQLRDVNSICRRSWYIAAHVWKINDLKIADDLLKQCPPKGDKYVIDEKLQHTDHLFFEVACFTFLNFV